MIFPSVLHYPTLSVGFGFFGIAVLHLDFSASLGRRGQRVGRNRQTDTDTEDSQAEPASPT